MEALELLLHGFSVALTPTNLLAALIGAVIGTFTGVLPGLGISGAISLLLPISFGLDPLVGLTLFAGVYFGAMYGGSTASILINVPGEGPSVVTAIDGYPMARKGRAGAALSISAISSFVGGVAGLIALVFFAPIIAETALAFGPPEYFCIGLLGLILLAGITGTSILRSSIMVLVGVMLGTVGLDPMTGIMRFTFGVEGLASGVNFIIVIMATFGLAEVIFTLSEKVRRTIPINVRLRDLYPSRDEMTRSVMPTVRGGIIGFLLGLLPGPSATISSFASYGVERKISRHPEEFGKGAIEGVAAPESANNGAQSSTLIPLLSLGLPFSSSAAMLLTGFLIHGITPGPMLITTHPDLFWGLVALLFIGNVFLLIVNLPFIPLFVALLRTPLHVLMPIVAVVIFLGGYVINNSVFDLWILLTFGVIGYLLRFGKYDAAPLVIGLFLGPIVETSLLQSMVLLDGNILNLFARPLTATMLGAAIAIAVGMVSWSVLKSLSRRQRPNEIKSESMNN